jgi:Cu+-exporting ATPase
MDLSSPWHRVAYVYSAFVVFFPVSFRLRKRTSISRCPLSSSPLSFRQVYGRDHQRSSAAIRKLLDLKPQTARIIRDVEVNTCRVCYGDEIVVVRPGEKIPTDGVVTEGHSSVDRRC